MTRAPAKGEHGSVFVGDTRLSSKCNAKGCEHPCSEVKSPNTSRDYHSISDYQVEGETLWCRITSQSGAKGTKDNDPKGSVPFACMGANARLNASS
jgi:hypothetical protein